MRIDAGHRDDARQEGKRWGLTPVLNPPERCPRYSNGLSELACLELEGFAVSLQRMDHDAPCNMLHRVHQVKKLVVTQAETTRQLGCDKCKA